MAGSRSRVFSVFCAKNVARGFRKRSLYMRSKLFIYFCAAQFHTMSLAYR